MKRKKDLKDLWQDDKITKSLQYYSEKLQPRHSLQIVANLKHEYKKGHCRVLSPQTAIKVLFEKL